MSHKSNKQTKSGIATILGVLIMVAILMTATVPLFFYMQQVNGYYDRKIADMKILDQERAMEDLEFYTVVNSSEVFLFLKNKGAIMLNLDRIWAKSIDLDQSKSLILNTSIELPPTTKLNTSLILDSGTYNFEITSNRGRKFVAYNNPIKVGVDDDDGDGGGDGGGEDVTHFLINVLIFSDPGNENYTVNVIGPEGYDQTRSTPQGNPSGLFNPSFAVPWEGLYEIKAYRVKNNKILETRYREVTLSWNYNNAVIKFDFRIPEEEGGGGDMETETLFNYTNLLTPNDNKIVNKNLSQAQSFIPTEDTNVTGIELILSAENAASGTLTVSIREHPTSGNLLTGILNIKVIGTTAAIYKINLSPSYMIQEGIPRYIVVESDDNKDVYWHCRIPGSSYTDGEAYWSVPGSGNWALQDCDFLFGIYGFPA
jgi:hypothetical protein